MNSHPPPSMAGRYSLNPYQAQDISARLSRVRGFKQSRLAKRATSFDGSGMGDIRRRSSIISPGAPSPYGDEYSPVSYYDEDEKHFLLDFPTSSRAASFSFPPDEVFPRRRMAIGLLVGVFSTLLLVLGLLVFAMRQPEEHQLWGMKSILEDFGVAVPYLHTDCENPYQEYGRMSVDLKVPENNKWVPYTPTCVPPALMAALRVTAPSKPPPLKLPTPHRSPSPDLPLASWLHGKTVLLFGDHIERLHNKDFCEFAGGAFTSIGRDHPLSPAPFLNGIDEKHNPGNTSTSEEARPAVCYVEQYDFMIVNVFHYGLANRVEFEHESLLKDEAFYPPVAVQDRLSAIVHPLLASLKRTPDLVEFSSGFWDLRHFTALDKQQNIDPFSALAVDRLQWYSDRLTKALTEVSQQFPDTPLLWRALHHPPKSTNMPFSRVAALDQLGRKVVANLNKSKVRGGSAIPLPPLVLEEEFGREAVLRKERDSTHAPFLNRVKERIGKVGDQVEVPHADELSATPIRIDEWGSLMLGQEHLMKGVDTPPLPGGYLWGDIMLFE
ncbi:hypothetical protein MNV49_007177 [Pseudohyphozyma bogoriensis]|nr:hypothetical protein MNV49_007177 [Pseudohyphozyma bogoriensis]